MNWYSVFYWISVADKVKAFFDSASNLFTAFAIISLIGVLICTIVGACITTSNSLRSEKEDLEDEDMRACKFVKAVFFKIMYISLFLSIVTWVGYIFCPSKNDALIIVAGGAVGNFITKDTAARQIPPEVMILLRDKIRSEINDIHVKDIINGAPDTLKSKTKEELEEIIRKQKN